jgi:hypothetical protein
VLADTAEGIRVLRRAGYEHRTARQWQWWEPRRLLPGNGTDSAARQAYSHPWRHSL